LLIKHPALEEKERSNYVIVDQMLPMENRIKGHDPSHLAPQGFGVSVHGKENRAISTGFLIQNLETLFPLFFPSSGHSAPSFLRSSTPVERICAPNNQV
jgi:hypothetical protein